MYKKLNHFKRRFSIFLMTAAIILTIIFIIGNGLTSGVDSNNNSETIAEIIQPIIDPMPVNEPRPSEDSVTFHKFVRKSAHFLEFALLGAELMTLKIILTRRIFSVLIFMPLFVSLLTGVIDEYLQLFTTRTSLVSDILIDFAGSICGMIFAAFIYCSFMFIKRKFTKRKNTLSQLS